jgi:hypothetical protein
MKIPMRKFPRSLLLVAGILPALQGCAAGALLGSTADAHPSVLVGEWVDLSHTAAGDTALWVLGAGGEDLARRVVTDSAGGPRGHVVSTIAYGHWHLRGALDDSVHRAICFSNRPGRSAPTCLAFSLDSTASPAQLAIIGYAGRHRSGTRQFVRRQLP